MKFVVVWARTDGTWGHGKSASDLETAKAWAEYGNSEYPEILHKVKGPEGFYAFLVEKCGYEKAREIHASVFPPPPKSKTSLT